MYNCLHLILICLSSWVDINIEFTSVLEFVHEVFIMHNTVLGFVQVKLLVFFCYELLYIRQWLVPGAYCMKHLFM